MGLHSRSLPHSEEAEKAVLAAVMLDAENNLPIALASLQTDDFYFERHQIIWESMVELSSQDIHGDLLTVQADLEAKEMLERSGGLAYLATIDVDLPDLSRIEEYCQIVVERSTRRRIIDAASRIYRNAFDGGLDATELLGLAESSLLGLSAGTKRSDPQPIGGFLMEAIDRVEATIAGEASAGLDTGFSDVDRVLQIGGGNLVLVAGRPGMGKTSLAMNMARAVAKKDRAKAVVVFTLEMSGVELGLRLLSSESDVEFALMRKGQLHENDWKIINSAANSLAKTKLLVDESSNPSIAEISSKVRRVKSEHGLSLVIVDYLQLMGGGGSDNRNLELGIISRGLKQIAKELDVPVIALSQLSRNPERRGGDHRPRLADLRESGSLEQDADSVVFVYRDEVYNPDEDNRGIAEIIVSKNRHGSTGTVELAFLGDVLRFQQIERYSEPPPDLFTR